MGGWIKIHRDIMAWEWWDDAVMVKSFLTILMLCNSEDQKWHGQTVQAGSFVTSLSKLSESLGLTIDRTRTVLSRLKNTGEITVKSTPHYTLVFLNNWGRYQENAQTNPTPNPKQQTADNQIDNCDFFNEIPQSIPREIPNKSQTNPNKQEVKNFKRVSKDTLSACADAPARESVFPFLQFWEQYGKKVEKKACERAYNRIPECDREKIKDHVPRYVASTPEVQYRKNPLTYLHGACWEDDIIVDETRQRPKVNRDEEGF